jgi:undecaprenyl-diphosphatase
MMLHDWAGRAGPFLLAVLLAGLVVVLVHSYGRATAGGLRRFLLPGLCLAAAVAFGKIANEVHEQETTAYDRAISLTLHRLDSPIMDTAMRAFTFLGSFPAVAAVALAVAIWLLRRRDKAGAAMLIGVAAVSEMLNLALKETFQRARPSLFAEIATLHSYSFPSGHAMSSAAIYGAVAVLWGRAYPGHTRAARLIAAALVLLIGTSRIYLGVHWFTDVIAGVAAGLFVLLAGTYWVQETDHARGK